VSNAQEATELLDHIESPPGGPAGWLATITYFIN
jgi:hypothetical protein